MENDIETLRGQILGLVGALNAIAAVLPDNTSAHASELLTELLASTKDSGLPPKVMEGMHSAMQQINGALQVSLHRTEAGAV
jgi:hypothetical protein